MDLSLDTPDDRSYDKMSQAQGDAYDNVLVCPQTLSHPPNLSLAYP